MGTSRRRDGAFPEAGRQPGQGRRTGLVTAWHRGGACATIRRTGLPGAQVRAVGGPEITVGDATGPGGHASTLPATRPSSNVRRTSTRSPPRGSTPTPPRTSAATTAAGSGSGRGPTARPWSHSHDPRTTRRTWHACWRPGSRAATCRRTGPGWTSAPPSSSCAAAASTRRRARGTGHAADRARRGDGTRRRRPAPRLGHRRGAPQGRVPSGGGRATRGGGRPTTVHVPPVGGVRADLCGARRRRGSRDTTGEKKTSPRPGGSWARWLRRRGGSAHRALGGPAAVSPLVAPPLVAVASIRPRAVVAAALCERVATARASWSCGESNPGPATPKAWALRA